VLRPELKASDATSGGSPVDRSSLRNSGTKPTQRISTPFRVRRLARDGAPNRRMCEYAPPASQLHRHVTTGSPPSAYNAQVSACSALSLAPMLGDRTRFDCAISLRLFGRMFTRRRRVAGPRDLLHGVAPCYSARSTIHRPAVATGRTRWRQVTSHQITRPRPNRLDLRPSRT
jgi:hypothetical protein